MKLIKTLKERLKEQSEEELIGLGYDKDLVKVASELTIKDIEELIDNYKKDTKKENEKPTASRESSAAEIKETREKSTNRFPSLAIKLGSPLSTDDDKLPTSRIISANQITSKPFNSSLMDSLKMDESPNKPMIIVIQDNHFLPLQALTNQLKKQEEGGWRSIDSEEQPGLYTKDEDDSVLIEFEEMEGSPNAYQLRSSNKSDKRLYNK